MSNFVFRLQTERQSLVSGENYSTPSFKGIYGEFLDEPTDSDTPQ